MWSAHDDHNRLRILTVSQVLWNVATGEAICGSPTHQDFVLCCRFFNTHSDKLVTGGNYNLQIWTYDRANNKLRSEDVKLGNLQRQFRSLALDQQDKFAYVGSTSGDVMQVGSFIGNRDTTVPQDALMCILQQVQAAKGEVHVHFGQPNCRTSSNIKNMHVHSTSIGSCQLAWNWRMFTLCTVA